MSTSIVPISRDLVDEAARVHLEGFSGYMNTKLGQRYVHSFIDWFRRQQQTIALAAVHGGELAGYVVGAPVGYDARMNKDLAFVAASSMLIRPWLFGDVRIRRRITARLKILLGRRSQGGEKVDLPNPTMSLVGICVSPRMRGKKIADQLMQAFEEEARSRGMKSLRLSVYKENSAARKLYEKHGWRPHDIPDEDSMYYSLLLG